MSHLLGGLLGILLGRGKKQMPEKEVRLDENWRTESVLEASRILVAWSRQPSPVNLELYSAPSLFIKGHISITGEDDPEPLEFHFTSISGEISKWIVLSPDVRIDKSGSIAVVIDFGDNNLGKCRIWKGLPRRHDPWVH
jgi:hypothetical protein